MGTRSSPALLDFKPMRDLQASWLTCSKTESINLTRSFLQVGQEDVGNEAGPSEGLAGFLLDFLPGTTTGPLRLQMFCTTVYI